MVMLSAISRLYIASLASSLATYAGSCSIKGIWANFCETMFAHSYDEKRSKRPSDARRMKSSLVGSISIILISGWIKTKLFIDFSPVVSSVISISLQSKSPNALVIASLPRTLSNTIYPPYFLILSCSSSRDYSNKNKTILQLYDRYSCR